MFKFLENVRFGVDWFNVMVKSSDVVGLIGFFSAFNEDMVLENWTISNTQIGFKRSLHFQGKNIIRVSYNPTLSNEWEANMDDSNNLNIGILVSISGDGCRYLASCGVLSEFFNYLNKFEYNCTRLDIYMDIFNSENKLVDLIYKAFYSRLFNEYSGTDVSTKMQLERDGNVKVIPVVDPFSRKQSWNVTVGNHGSNFGMFRCYNKLAELCQGRLQKQFEDVAQGRTYWYRLEYELHKGNAQKYFKMLMLDSLSFEVLLPHVYSAVASSMFRIVSISENLETVRHADTDEFWEEFLMSLRNLTFIQENIDGVVSEPYVKNKSVQKLQSNGERIACSILFQILAMKLSKSYCKEVISPEVVSRCLHSPQYVDLRSDFRDNYDVDLEVEINNLLKEVS